MKKIVILLLALSLFSCRKFDKVTNGFEFKLLDESLYDNADALSNNTNQNVEWLYKFYIGDISFLKREIENLSIPKKHRVKSHIIEKDQITSEIQWKKDDFKIELTLKETFQNFNYDLNYLPANQKHSFSGYEISGYENITQTKGSFESFDVHDDIFTRINWSIDSIDNSFTLDFFIQTESWYYGSIKTFPNGEVKYRINSFGDIGFRLQEAEWDKEGSGFIQYFDEDSVIYNEVFF